MTHGWPVTLREGRVGLRPLQRADSAAWHEVRRRNAAWLRPWDATVPQPDVEPAPTFPVMVRRLRAEARDGRCLPFALTYDHALAGQVTVGGITWGSLRGGHVGYWVDRDLAGRGIVPTAVALAVDHCFSRLGLHRVEVNVRPENAASRRVVEKLGFRPEGLRERYLHIDGHWRDHLTYVLTAEEVGDGLLARWRRTRPGAS